jgi:hypothetical protein
MAWQQVHPSDTLSQLAAIAEAKSAKMNMAPYL